MARAVVPFENSTNGSVVFTLDLFADRNDTYPDISVCGEIYHDVHHYLLGHRSRESKALSPQCSTPTLSKPQPSTPRSAPLASLEHVRRIYSHPQAFTQCELFLETYLKGVERVDASSTSKAAELVAADQSGKSVAIASQAAAMVHNLDILGAKIENKSNNTTRFFVLRKGLEPDQIDLDGPFTTQSRRNSDECHHQSETVPEKTLVSFTTGHTPGALANALDAFRANELNLTSINQRPSEITNFQYIFFVEFQGSKYHDPEGKAKAAFECLDRTTEAWRWLGSWKDELVGRRDLEA